MPIYEEKLICPLAIRFAQEHIRPIFQDGCHDLESTIKQIQVRPGGGQGDYDVILSAPFPNIEIVRWYQQEERHAKAGPSKFWFTLDNRRLYCLQRAAMALWPRRCAAVVEVLYAVTDGIWRKDNSSTAGKSVFIGHSMKQITGSWHWPDVVPDGEAATQMEALVETDSNRASIKELLDAPAAPSMLELFFCHGEDDAPSTSAEKVPASQASSRKPVGGTKVPLDARTAASEVSTGDPLSPRSVSASDADSDGVRMVPPGWVGIPALDAALAGQWVGEKGESYEITGCPKKTSWTCVRTDTNDKSSRRFTLWYDESTDAVWWGNLNLYLDASRMRRGQPVQICWLSERDDGRPKKRFHWQRLQATPLVQTSTAGIAPAVTQKRGQRRRAAA